MQSNDKSLEIETRPLPKPQFSYVGRMYQAVIATGVSVGSLNQDRADTVVRTLSKTNWKNENLDLYSMWNTGGDNWRQLIKDVKEYSRTVSKNKKSTPPASA